MVLRDLLFINEGCDQMLSQGLEEESLVISNTVDGKVKPPHLFLCHQGQFEPVLDVSVRLLLKDGAVRNVRVTGC